MKLAVVVLCLVGLVAADPAYLYGSYNSPYYSSFGSVYSPYTTSGLVTPYTSTFARPYASSWVSPYTGYSTVHALKKRSADPEPEPEPEADPLYYTSPYYSGLRTGYTGYAGYAGVSPYTTTSAWGVRPYTTSSWVSPYTGYSAVHALKKRSADPEPEPEADPLYYASPYYSGLRTGYTGYAGYTGSYVSPYTTTSTWGVRPYSSLVSPYSAYSTVHALKKRSADPEPEPEADPAYLYSNAAYTTPFRSVYSPYVSTAYTGSYVGNYANSWVSPYSAYATSPYRYVV